MEHPFNHFFSREHEASSQECRAAPDEHSCWLWWILSVGNRVSYTRLKWQEKEDFKNVQSSLKRRDGKILLWNVIKGWRRARQLLSKPAEQRHLHFNGSNTESPGGGGEGGGGCNNKELNHLSPKQTLWERGLKVGRAMQCGRNGERGSFSPFTQGQPQTRLCNKARGTEKDLPCLIQFLPWR